MLIFFEPNQLLPMKFIIGLCSHCSLSCIVLFVVDVQVLCATNMLQRHKSKMLMTLINPKVLITYFTVELNLFNHVVVKPI